MMSSLVIQERDALTRLLEDCLGDLVQIVTADEQKARDGRQDRTGSHRRASACYSP